MPRRRRTDISAGTTATSPGSARTRRMRSVQRPGSSAPSPNPTPETVLITGGAGFIGSHLAGELQARGHRVRALDAVIPRVHGDAGRPDEIAADDELQEGDVRD